jgi:hypothetical protein
MPMLSRVAIISFLVLNLATTLAGCGSGGSEAQRRGVGAACTQDSDCLEDLQVCLSFKGGYCGIADCQADADCPSGSACVFHGDGRNYCFLICTDKPQCNLYRPVDSESNCSANVTFTNGSNSSQKACVPPSG